MTRDQIVALEKAWASQDPKPGYDRVAMVLSVEDAYDGGAEVRAHVELPPAVVLWLMRTLGQMVNARISPPISGHAVVAPDGAFVGIWRDREIAEKIVNRSRSAKGERIRPMVFVDPT